MADSKHDSARPQSPESTPCNRLRPAVPALPVKDCAAAIRYYCDVLGFRMDYDDAILGRDVVLFAGVSRDDFRLTLNQHDTQACTLTIGCEVDDADALYRELVERGVRIFLEPRDEPWGERHMAIEDPDGHHIHFSSPLPGQAGE